jgi:hypothetical protein
MKLFEVVWVAQSERGLQRGDRISGSVSILSALVPGGDSKSLLLLCGDKSEDELQPSALPHFNPIDV